MGYAQARKDFEYLESIKFLDDAVEIDAMVFDLMRKPNKKQAEIMYLSCITMWFSERSREGFHSKCPALHKVARRYNEKLSKVGLTK